MTTTSEPQGQAEQSAAPNKQSSRKSILVLSIVALAINSTCAIYTLPYTLPSLDIPRPDFSRLAELLPRHKPSAPKPDPVVAALNEIQSAQRQQSASLQGANSSLQQNIALLQQDSTALASLRESITDQRVDAKKISSQISEEHVDVKKMSAQISTLIAKVDSLQNALAPEITSSIPKTHTRNRLSAELRKTMVRQSKSAGPVSVGGAPLSPPATVPASEN